MEKTIINLTWFFIMTNKLLFLFLCLFLCLNFRALSSVSPKLKVSIGYPYVKIQDNSPNYSSDFLAIAFGAKMQFELNDKNRINLTIDTSYSPGRVNFNFQRKNREIDGKTSLLTTFYSASYATQIYNSKKYKYFLNIGPTLGIYTLNYSEIDFNDSNISKVNRVRVRTRGFRVSFVQEDKNKNYIEYTFIYSRPTRFTLIDDSTNDAQALTRSKFSRNSETILFVFSLGWDLLN